jgi:signal transduction histidine kinase
MSSPPDDHAPAAPVLPEPTLTATARPRPHSKPRSIGVLLGGLVGVQAFLLSGFIAFAAVNDSLRDRIGLGVAIVLVAGLVGGAIHRRIAQPVQALDEAIDEAAHGNLSLITVPYGPAELARLADRFNSVLEMRARAEEAVVDAYDAERAAADRLRELDDLKNAFLMAISHELRTPLTSVVGYAALLEDGIRDLSPDEAAEFAGAIGVSARRLDGLLIDLLDMERCNRGVVEPRYRLSDVRELIRRLLEHTSYDGRVAVNVAKGTKAVVDPALLERMVENLVMNAIKHTPEGTAISISVERLADALILSVEDEGPGVPDELKEAIFEPFRHGGAPEHTPGTGIGLALVSQFAKVQGGQAWVEDRVGGGASFRISLPAEPKIVRLAS